MHINVHPACHKVTYRISEKCLRVCVFPQIRKSLSLAGQVESEQEEDVSEEEDTKPHL